MNNIVSIAENSNNCKTLVDAFKVTDLVETLSKTGPFTFFAPSDRAFAKLPLNTITTLWSNLPQLRNFLTYHLVRGKLMKADLENIAAVASIQGFLIPIDFSKGFSVNNITVVSSDLEADNGVIHVIDDVISFQ
jgi:uncharacterized surface protein with fasciclin (FAS1) repeats